MSQNNELTMEFIKDIKEWLTFCIVVSVISITCTLSFFYGADYISRNVFNYPILTYQTDDCPQ